MSRVAKVCAKCFLDHPTLHAVRPLAGGRSGLTPTLDSWYMGMARISPLLDLTVLGNLSRAPLCRCVARPQNIASGIPAKSS